MTSSEMDESGCGCSAHSNGGLTMSGSGASTVPGVGRARQNAWTFDPVAPRPDDGLKWWQFMVTTFESNGIDVVRAQLIARGWVEEGILERRQVVEAMPDGGRQQLCLGEA